MPMCELQHLRFKDQPHRPKLHDTKVALPSRILRITSALEIPLISILPTSYSIHYPSLLRIFSNLRHLTSLQPAMLHHRLDLNLLYPLITFPACLMRAALALFGNRSENHGVVLANAAADVCDCFDRHICEFAFLLREVC